MNNTSSHRFRFLPQQLRKVETPPKEKPGRRAKPDPLAPSETVQNAEMKEASGGDKPSSEGAD